MLTYYVNPRRRLASRLAQLNDNRHPDVYVPVDVIVDGDDYLISAFLPGVSPEDVNIEVLEDTVSISGEFSAEANEDVRYLLQERPNGRFHRKLRLPVLLKASDSEAEVKDGVLSLRVPMAEEAKAKKIKVQENK